MRFRSNWILEVLVFEGRGKRENGKTEEKLLGTKREPTTNSTSIWLRRRDLIPGQIGGRRMLPPLRNPCSPSSSESRSLVIIVARNDGKRERGRLTPFIMISSHRFPRAAVLTIIVIVLFLENQWETLRRKDYTNLGKDYAARIPIVVLSRWTLPLYKQTTFSIASHADITRDEPLRTSAWEATFQ